MIYHAQITSPLGNILLCAGAQGLTGLYFVGQKDCPPLSGLPPPINADPTAGALGGVPLKSFRVHRRAEAALQPQLDFFQKTATRAQMAVATQDSSGLPQNLQAGTPPDVAGVFEQTQRELMEYFQGLRKTFTIPLRPAGTPFQQKVWNALLAIPYGDYVSYADVAQAAGLSRKHGRPVGVAVGHNPIAIIIPCHRVLSSSGALNGYTGGLDRKRALLALEGLDIN
jgi:methylated-DNA-[protein]-cysteine S-methyltransferase